MKAERSGGNPHICSRLVGGTGGLKILPLPPLCEARALLLESSLNLRGLRELLRHQSYITLSKQRSPGYRQELRARAGENLMGTTPAYVASTRKDKHEIRKYSKCDILCDETRSQSVMTAQGNRKKHHRRSPTGSGQDQKNELEVSRQQGRRKTSSEKGKEFYLPSLRESVTEALLGQIPNTPKG